MQGLGLFFFCTVLKARAADSVSSAPSAVPVGAAWLLVALIRWHLSKGKPRAEMHCEVPYCSQGVTNEANRVVVLHQREMQHLSSSLGPETDSI